MSMVATSLVRGSGGALRGGTVTMAARSQQFFLRWDDAVDTNEPRRAVSRQENLWLAATLNVKLNST
jgi:hypothetical protein